MGRQPSIMVPLALLFVLPLVAAGGHDMGMMKNMMNMMEMMNQAKGWGAKATEAPAKADDWYNMQSQEDYEAYLKWCEENRARTAEFQKQQELLNQFKAREEARKMEQEKERAKMEAEERQKNMMAEWKMWEKKMQMTHSFDSVDALTSPLRLSVSSCMRVSPPATKSSNLLTLVPSTAQTPTLLPRLLFSCLRENKSSLSSEVLLMPCALVPVPTLNRSRHGRSNTTSSSVSYKHLSNALTMRAVSAE